MQLKFESGTRPDIIVNPIGAIGPRGPEGPQGPAGTGSVAEAQLYDQIEPASTWIIPHTFARTPAVQLVVDGQISFADVSFPPGIVSISFATPTSGSVVLT